MKTPRVYDVYNRLQCKTCKQFLDAERYYRHTSNRRYKDHDDHICKRCQRTSPVADTSRANARAKYATDPVHRAAQITKAKQRYWANRDKINAYKRAIWLARKYAAEINKNESPQDLP